MPVKITAIIDNITEADFDRFWRAWQDGPGARFEVVLDRIDGDHIETELHFRVVEEHATRYYGPQHPARGPVTVKLEGAQQLPPGEYTGRVADTDFKIDGQPEITLKVNAPTVADWFEVARMRERERYPLRTVHFGGLAGSDPVFETPVPQNQGLHRRPELDVSRLAELLAQLIAMEKISPRVLGIPGEGGLLAERIYLYLTGGEQTMGKHGDGKPADSKPGGSKGGGAHEGGSKGGK